MTNWIKHTPGQPCPVPIEWVRAVVRVSGGTRKIHNGKILYRPTVGGEFRRSRLGFHSAFCEDWQDPSCADDQITHFKLKKKYRARYKQQQEQAVMTNTLSPAEQSMYQPGEDSTSVEQPHRITRTESTTVTVSCGDRSAVYDKAVYDEHQGMIDAWVTRVEIEIKTRDQPWNSRQYPENQLHDFDLDKGNYRIKPREPKAGEVWESITDEYFEFLLNGCFKNMQTGQIGEKYSSSDDFTRSCVSYHSPSVKAYIARKLLDVGEGSKSLLHEKVDDACRHGE